MKKSEDVKELTNVTDKNTEFDMDLSLPDLGKKRIRIDGDDNRILYINPQDMLTLDRFKETYPKLRELAIDAAKKLTDTSSDFDKFAGSLKDIDTQMRKYMDYIFNANVAETCCVDGSMYDPVNGKFRFEHIFEVLFKLYTDNISKELNKMATNIKRHTDKYTK